MIQSTKKSILFLPYKSAFSAIMFSLSPEESGSGLHSVKNVLCSLCVY